jgi:hypothetical protein
MNLIILFKNRFGNNQMRYLTEISTSHLQVLLNGYPLIPKLIHPMNHLCDLYNSHPKFSSFLSTIKPNISKLTIHNISPIFHLYLLAHPFRGFERWGPGNHSTPKLNLIAHYDKHIKNSLEDWEHYISLSRSQITPQIYHDFALETSTKMTHLMVHTNGRKVYLSGVYEKVLIIGRLDASLQLGISSCYIITDESFERKMKVFRDNICFNVD